MTDFLDTAIPEAIADEPTQPIPAQSMRDLVNGRSVLDALRAKIPRGCRLLTATELADAECDGNNGVDDRERGWQRHMRIEVRS